MKKILLISVVFVLLLLACAKKDLNPLSPGTVDLTVDDNPVEVIGFSGTIFEDRDSVGVDPDDEASWIYIHFNDVIDDASTGLVVEEVGGSAVAYSLEWTVSGGETDVLMKPQGSLDYNETYVLKLIGSDIMDENGNELDRDGDFIEGESPDDDYHYPFQTFKSDDTDGDWPDYTSVDTVNPVRWTGIRYYIGGTQYFVPWIDVDVGLYVFDDTDTTGLVAIDPATVNENTVKLIEVATGNEVVADEVTYEDDDTDPQFGLILFEPASDLNPGAYYKFLVLGSIADKAGNKVDEDDYIEYEGTFRTLCCDHDSSTVTEDATPPDIFAWYDYGNYFEVEFNEEIDDATINLGTIYLLDYVGGPRIDGVLSTRVEAGHTIVRFTTLDGSSISGDVGYVTAEIKDLAGNRRGYTSSFSF